MRLLVPNARNAQAYTIVQSLRPLAARVVVVAERRWPGEAALAHAVYSPGVDRRASAPWPAGDWERGHHPAENTPDEAAYIARLEALCREERLDTVFPSTEATIYVLAKNAGRLAGQGVSVVVPPADVVRLVNDKLRCMERLADAGLPIPRTQLPAPDALRRASDALGFPLVVKPRHASASRGVHIVRELAGLEAAYATVARRYGPPIVQEYVPGALDGRFVRVIGVADADGTMVSAHVCRTLLTVFPGVALPPAVARSEANPALVDLTRAIVRRLGLVGPFLLQFKEDARDGAPKLIEANSKISYRAWTAMADGVDVPRIVLETWRRGHGPTVAPAQVGTLFVNGPELWAARWLRPHETRRLRPLLRGTPRVWDPYTAGFIRTPGAALMWWATFLGFAVKERLARQLAAAAWGLARRGLTRRGRPGQPRGP